MSGVDNPAMSLDERAPYGTNDYANHHQNHDNKNSAPSTQIKRPPPGEAVDRDIGPGRCHNLRNTWSRLVGCVNS